MLGETCNGRCERDGSKRDDQSTAIVHFPPWVGGHYGLVPSAERTLITPDASRLEQAAGILAGAKTPLAAIFSAAFLVLALVILAPLAQYLPLAALALADQEQPCLGQALEVAVLGQAGVLAEGDVISLRLQ